MVGTMAMQQMQMSQTSTAAPTFKRTPVIVAIVAALAVGALIGRETVVGTRTGSVPGAAVRPAIALTGTDSTDAARRAEVFQAIAKLDRPDTTPTVTNAELARIARRSP